MMTNSVSESWVPPLLRSGLVFVSMGVLGYGLVMTSSRWQLAALISIAFVFVTYDAYHSGYELAKLAPDDAYHEGYEDALDDIQERVDGFEYEQAADGET